MSGGESFARLKALLEPLRLYRFDEGTVSGGELYAAGRAVDEFGEKLEYLSAQLDPRTAGEEGIAAYERELGLRAPGDLEARRRSVLALMGYGGAMSIGDLRSLLAAAGLEVGVREASGEDELIEVFFPGVAGVPADFERVQAIIERFLPCHLEAKYVYNYITWTLFEAHFPTWDALDASGLSWNAIELIIE